jgi:hypothetical protein
MSNFGLRASIRFLGHFQILAEAFRLGLIRVLVKVSDELEDISSGIDEIIEEKVFGDLDLDEDNSDA